MNISFQQVDIVFQVIVFLFAISVHESAHAWTAYRLGDPTAYMVGRVSLNPIRHIDPIGTVVMPLLALLTHFPVIGWAKPTPVNTRNFKRFVRDDVLTSMAGPVSNFVVATVCVILLSGMALTMPSGRDALLQARQFKWTGGFFGPQASLLPLALLLYEAMFINVMLGIFNIIPVPPLDGSHVLRHFLAEPIRRVYDNVGRFGLILLLFFGGRLLWTLMSPILGIFDGILARI